MSVSMYVSISIHVKGQSDELKENIYFTKL